MWLCTFANHVVIYLCCTQPSFQHRVKTTPERGKLRLPPETPIPVLGEGFSSPTVKKTSSMTCILSLRRDDSAAKPCWRFRHKLPPNSSTGWSKSVPRAPTNELGLSIWALHNGAPLVRSIWLTTPVVPRSWCLWYALFHICVSSSLVSYPYEVLG